MINTEELQKLLNNTQYKLLNSISSNNSYNNEEYTENIEIIFDSLQNSLKIIKSLQPNDNSNPSSYEIENREKIIRNLFDDYIGELEIINQKINTGIEVSITDFKEMASDATLIEYYIKLSVPKNTSYTQYYNKTRNYLSFLEKLRSHQLPRVSKSVFSPPKQAPSISVTSVDRKWPNMLSVLQQLEAIMLPCLVHPVVVRPCSRSVYLQYFHH